MSSLTLTLSKPIRTVGGIVLLSKVMLAHTNVVFLLDVFLKMVTF